MMHTIQYRLPIRVPSTVLTDIRHDNGDGRFPKRCVPIFLQNCEVPLQCQGQISTDRWCRLWEERPLVQP